MSDVLGLIVERIHIRLVLEALESLYFSVGYKNFVSKLKSEFLQDHGLLVFVINFKFKIPSRSSCKRLCYISLSYKATRLIVSHLSAF